jgi:hypothetical protein
MSETPSASKLGSRIQSIKREVTGFYRGVFALLKITLWVLAIGTVFVVLILVGFGFIHVNDIVFDWSRTSIKVDIADAPAGSPAPTASHPAENVSAPPAPQPAPALAQKAASEVVLVIDRSDVPPDEEEAFAGAKRAARDFVAALDDQIRFSLLAVNDKCVWAVSDLNLATDRARALGKIDSLFAEGGTALGDGVAMAAAHLRTSGSASTPGVVVVLTTAHGDKSQLSPGELDEKLKPQAGQRPVRVYTIVYGPTAAHVDESAIARGLREAAATTGGAFFLAGSDSVAQIFQRVREVGLTAR